jgi:putative FmdB family regulatory protein
MPLFEYQCRDCGKQFTFLAGVVSENADPHCPRCEGSNLTKLMSRFRRGRSDDARMDDLAERLDGNDFDDPGALRRLAREMGREISTETGEDLTDELEEMIELESRGQAEGPSTANGDDGTIY